MIVIKAQPQFKPFNNGNDQPFHNWNVPGCAS